jgi:predicted transcriptional regulator YdeE
MIEPKVVNREAITVPRVQPRLTNVDKGVPEMWERRFVVYHDRIVAMSTDQIYYGCAISTAQPETCEYLAGTAVPVSTDVPEGLTLREIPGCASVMVECTVNTMYDAIDLIEDEWLLASSYQGDASRPAFDCYPPGTVSNGSPICIYVPIAGKAK